MANEKDLSMAEGEFEYDREPWTLTEELRERATEKEAEEAESEEDDNSWNDEDDNDDELPQIFSSYRGWSISG